MKWILTENDVLINIDTIGTIHVLKKKELKSIRTENGFDHTEEIKYAVVADLNYFDSERDFLALTKEMDSKVRADAIMKELILRLVSDKTSDCLMMKRLVDSW